MFAQHSKELGVGISDTISSNTDLNTIKKSGRYLLNAIQCTNAYTSNAIRGTLEVIQIGIGIIQRITEEYPSTAVYVRGYWNENWADWSRTDNFGCNTPAELASALGGMMSRAEAVTQNLSNYTTSGTYGIKAGLFTPSDLPSNICSYGVMHVHKNVYVTTQDVYGIKSDSKERWQRWSDNGGDSWSSWQRLDNFGCNTLAELKAALANV